MIPDLTSYDHVIVAFSGGKDSTACVLHLLERGVPRDKIELWHHDVDGREGSTIMDWPVTRAYCEAFARALGLKLYYSWRTGGFEREMLRENQRTAPVEFETPGDNLVIGGIRGKLGTRRKFPQTSANLSVRWCSGSLKVDVMSVALNNQRRFLGRRTLVVTGERAEESAARAKYQTFEPHRCHRKKRHVDHWRPIHAWPEADVWAIIERHRVRPTTWDGAVCRAPRAFLGLKTSGPACGRSILSSSTGSRPTRRSSAARSIGRRAPLNWPVAARPTRPSLTRRASWRMPSRLNTTGQSS